MSLPAPNATHRCSGRQALRGLLRIEFIACMVVLSAALAKAQSPPEVVQLRPLTFCDSDDAHLETATLATTAATP